MTGLAAIVVVGAYMGECESALWDQSHDTDECESALEARYQIGSSQLLLSSSPPTARLVIYSAFDSQGHGRQLVSALVSVSAKESLEPQALGIEFYDSPNRFLFLKMCIEATWNYCY
ncbi:hypothetical protein RchiOBHm_Chr1g0340011 [Rosa chinensis]|uniref:Uncharacterized protein n=1 Tax=Rosa chinensis TaxID=74649 RepID=A0A2P6SDF0_ROSCH|nr:hypothetical protein RchiOBHm_Chr1g0340011 [Rosa chinensis]